MSSLTQNGVHVPHPYMNSVTVLLAWHSTWYNRQPLHTKSTKNRLGRVGQGNGLNIRYLLQLPLKLTLPDTSNLHCLLRLDSLSYYYSDVQMLIFMMLPIVRICICSWFGMYTFSCVHFFDMCFSTRYTRYRVFHISANGLGFAEVGRS
jgi:hypothetical protein